MQSEVVYSLNTSVMASFDHLGFQPALQNLWQRLWWSWLRKSPTCRQHVAPTAKCCHFWPKCPCCADTILIPTHFFLSGFADIHQIFLFSTIGTYVEFLCKIWLKYLFDIRSSCTFLLLSTPKFKIFAVTRALPT